MPASHHTEIRDGETIDVLLDTERGWRLKISRLGAELVSVARSRGDGDWRGFLYRNDDITRAPSGWNNHSTVMGFYTHRIRNEQTVYRDHPIHGSTHSFLRLKRFDPPEFDGAALTYRLRPEQIEAHEYPFPLTFRLRYALQDDDVRVTFLFENPYASQRAHVSFGLHPGWACTSTETVEIEMPPGRYVRHLAPGNFLSGETEEIDFAGGPMPFPRSILPISVLLELKDVPQPLFIVRDREGGREISMRLDEVPYITLWSDGNPFVCLEPCWGLPDHHAQRPFEEKLGIETVPAAGRLEKSFTFRATIL